MNAPFPVGFIPEALRTRITALTRAAFWLACAIVLWSTLTDTESLQRGMWDKALHFIAFYGLAVMGAVAFPEIRLRWIGAGLLAFGLGIEVMQKFVGRDSSWLDFFADGVGVVFALAPIALDRLRRQLM